MTTFECAAPCHLQPQVNICINLILVSSTTGLAMEWPFFQSFFQYFVSEEILETNWLGKGYPELPMWVCSAVPGVTLHSWKTYLNFSPLCVLRKYCPMWGCSLQCSAQAVCSSRPGVTLQQKTSSPVSWSQMEFLGWRPQENLQWAIYQTCEISYFFWAEVDLGLIIWTLSINIFRSSHFPASYQEY